MIKEEISPVNDNVSSSCDEMFQDNNVPVVSEEPNNIIEQIKPEAVEPPPESLRRNKRKCNTKLNREKKKPGPKPKKVETKPKLKEKKVRDKKENKEKRKEVCPVCGMLVSFLPYHLEVHDPNIFYDCDICGHRAPSRTVIINHFRNKHFSKRFGLLITFRIEYYF